MIDDIQFIQYRWAETGRLMSKDDGKRNIYFIVPDIGKIKVERIFFFYVRVHNLDRNQHTDLS